ncbi:hypothetical protein TNCT_508791 [Trichonephila clavata]|uniref:Uncharacterized protein n=1 Tax=Trichonephila clavata TaxID=2740835 RepID=A0A8X6J5K1_TRICU|nr:hypothetical protein TNCT_508791 [Trichonephila clavata]
MHSPSCSAWDFKRSFARLTYVWVSPNGAFSPFSSKVHEVKLSSLFSYHFLVVPSKKKYALANCIVSSQRLYNDTFWYSFSHFIGSCPGSPLKIVGFLDSARTARRSHQDCLCVLFFISHVRFGCCCPFRPFVKSNSGGNP